MDTQVVSLASGATPSPGSAAIRWLTVIAIPLVVEGTGFPDIFDLGWGVLVLLPILKPPLHRGLDDRAAATVVTSLRPAGRDQPMLVMAPRDADCTCWAYLPRKPLV